MLPTPSTSHVNYGRVYEPAEDSFLLLDTLSSAKERSYLQSRFPKTAATPLVLEVGTGSGVVLAFVTAHAEHIFQRPDVATMGIDINHFATAATAETTRNAVANTRTKNGARKSGLLLDTMVGDLAGNLRQLAADVLLFNPPYVPSENVPATPALQEGQAEDSHNSFDRDSHMLYLSTDGGADGMEVTDRLLAQLPEVLSERGVAYVLLCAQNKPDAVMSRIRTWEDGAWVVERVGSSGKTAGWERLCIIRISRSLG